MKKVGVQGLLAAAACLAIGVASTATAAPERQREYHLEEQDLGTALRSLGQASGGQIIFPADAVEGKRSPRLDGAYTLKEAVDLLLRGTGLVALDRKGLILIRGRGSSAEIDASAERDEIVVTGSQIRGTGPVGSSVTQITRSDLDKSGYVTVQQVLQKLPQNYGGGVSDTTFGISNFNGASNGTWGGASVNLRGLGVSSTLVLVNSHRQPAGAYGSFTDISLIPTTAIDHIEVLADGASAIYGSDAVAGVVNIALRNKFEGAETRARYGTADGDYSEIQASQIFGRAWETGNFVVAYEYYHRGNLLTDKRAFAREDLRPFGGGDYRSGYANPGTIVAGGRLFAIPAGQDGTHLSPSDLIAGQSNKRDSREGADLLPRQSRHSAYASLEQEVAAGFTLFGNALYASRKFHRLYSQADTQTAITVPTTNPFYVDPVGTARPVSLRYSFVKDLGQPLRVGTVKVFSAAGGGRLELGPWQAEFTGIYGLERDSQATLNVRNSARLAQVLADPNPASAFNPLGDGSHTNPATIDRIRGSYAYRTRNEYWSASAKADGPLFALPGGDVKLAFGTEYREEKMTSTETLDTATLAPASSVRTDFPGGRNVLASYGELYIPLFSHENARGGLHKLALSLAGRIERYSDFGTTTNPRVGVTWEPIDGVRLRGTYGKSFRAPLPSEVAQGPIYNGYLAYQLPDSGKPVGFSNVLLVLGNDPNMGPERATTWTASLDLEPKFLPGLGLTLTYYSVSYKDRIADVTADAFNFLEKRAIYAPIINEQPTAAQIADLFTRPEFSNPFGLAETDITAIINAQRQNLSSVKQSGLDFDLHYDFQLGGGAAQAGVDGSYIFRIDQAVTSASSPQNIVNAVGSPIDLRLRGRLAWSRDGFGFAAFVNYTGNYRNTLLAAEPKISSWTTVDLQLSYELPQKQGLLGGLTLSLGATNLFDRDPPYVEYYNGDTAIGYDPENADPLGRVISLQVTKRW
ncbi:TonB-dependent receptor [Novosphingobium sp. G106]|uniref:TonB-dependent receptor n=1 Tax=Novosphingobium sp. G106 TaxID=2849500 RepID=UPI001C2DE5CD|nr:TonB-dependent receptor [Novosphingobium sp. G106]MBV1686410.1 TonB-dependent receptor [Novosphingobium sp. G106]